MQLVPYQVGHTNQNGGLPVICQADGHICGHSSKQADHPVHLWSAEPDLLTSEHTTIPRIAAFDETGQVEDGGHFMRWCAMHTT